MDDLLSIVPLWLPALGFLAVLLVEVIQPDRRSNLPMGLSLVTLLATLLQLGGTPAVEQPFGGMLAVDAMATGFWALMIVITGVVIVTAEPYLRELRLAGAEVYALLLAALTGMMIVVAARDLIVLFLGIELLSIPLYVLAAYRRLRSHSVEGGFKYFLIGAFASGFLIYGIALLYAATGTTRYADVALASHGASVLYQIGVTLVLVGLGFKVAAAPFHTWAPDVYQGAPTPITAFMATGVKAAGFGAVLRLVLEVLPPSAALQSGLTVIAAITMLVGNLGALLQTNLKRMLAYSSIGHAGYLLLGVIAALLKPTSTASSAVLFYLCTYALMTLGAFSVLVHLLRQNQEGEDLRGLQGLSRGHPYLAFALSLCFLSLAGIPFTAGFFGKLYLLRAAWSADLVTLSVFLVIASVISLYYYLRVIVAMYMKPPQAAPVERLPSPLLTGVTVVCAIGILFVGIYPTPLLGWLS